MAQSNKKKEETKVGRPSRFTPEIIEKLEHAFAIGCTDQEAIYYADVPASSFYLYMKTHPDFVDKRERLKSRPVFRARTAVMSAISDGDVNTARWLLERKLKDEFSTKVEEVHSGGFSIVVGTEEEKEALEKV